MPSIYDWDTIAGNNQLSDTAVDWREGQLPSTVNNSARAMMGRIAEFRKDLGGTVTSTNVADAYSVTANSAFSALADGLVLTFIASATNTTNAPTLAANGTSAKSLRRLGPTGADDAALYEGQIRINQKYTVRYSTAAHSSAGAWIVENPSDPGFVELDAMSTAPTPVSNAASYSDSSGDLHQLDSSSNDIQLTKGGAPHPFATGTRMVFHQSAAPTGWTQDTTINDQVLRIVSTTGGGSGGSWSLSGVTVDSHTLSIAEMPSHAHSATVTDPGHTHSLNNAANVDTQGGSFGFNNGTNAGYRTISANAANTGIAVSIGSNGSGSGHTHGITADGTWRPAYQDVIVCSKD